MLFLYWIMFCDTLLQYFPFISEHKELRSSYIAICVFNNLLTYTAVMLNIVTMHAIRKSSSWPKTTKTLLLSLAVSDVGVGLFVQPFYTSLLVSWLQKNSPTCFSYRMFSNVGLVFSQASFLGVVAVSVDRFLAVHLHLRYQELVTHKRVVAVVTSIWVLSAFVSFIILSGLRVIQIAMQSIAVLTGLAVTTVVYIKLCLVVRRHKTQIHSLQVEGVPSSEMTQLAGLIKSSVSTFHVYVAFLVCYLPYWICLTAVRFNGPTTTLKRFHLFSLILIFVNSSLNPVIYCWKMRHIRRAIMDILRNMAWKISLHRV